MEFISSNWRDIQKYYDGTYIKFAEYGDRLFYVSRTTPEMIEGTDEDDTIFQLHLSDAHPYNVNYVLPHKATFQWNDNVYMMRRIPARQYRRGLCSDNTSIISVATGNNVDISFKSLKAFTAKPQYSSFRDAFFAKGRFKAIALSPRLTYLRNGSILVDTTKVATFDFHQKKIVLHHKIFLPEIMQHMVDHNETFEVIQ